MNLVVFLIFQFNFGCGSGNEPIQECSMVLSFDSLQNSILAYSAINNNCDDFFYQNQPGHITFLAYNPLIPYQIDSDLYVNNEDVESLTLPLDFSEQIIFDYILELTSPETLKIPTHQVIEFQLTEGQNMSF